MIIGIFNIFAYDEYDEYDEYDDYCEFIEGGEIMIKKETKDFVNKVKGKRIKGNNWPEGRYLVPNGRFDEEDCFLGTTYYEDGEIRENTYYWISNGFSQDEEGYYWEFVDKY